MRFQGNTGSCEKAIPGQTAAVHRPAAPPPSSRSGHIGSRSHSSKDRLERAQTLRNTVISGGQHRAAPAGLILSTIECNQSRSRRAIGQKVRHRAAAGFMLLHSALQATWLSSSIHWSLP